MSNHEEGQDSRGSGRSQGSRGSSGGYRGNKRNDNDRRGGYSRGPKRDDRRDSRESRDGERRDFRGGDRRDNRGGDRRWDDRGPKRDGNRGKPQGAGRDRGRGDREGGRVDTRASVRESGENLPDVDRDVTGEELDKWTQRELQYLDEFHRGWVARHLVMTARYLDDDPELAFKHATAAARRGGRVGIVREAVGIAAYACGKYQDALRELRTYRRITGDDQHIALIADCERALGREGKAMETVTSPEARALTGAARAEAAIVEAGILLDDGKTGEAVKALEISTLDINRAYEFSPRLYEAYADALEADGEEKESKRWRARIAVAERALGTVGDDEEAIVDFGEGPDVDEPADPEAVALIEAQEEEAREAKRAAREAKRQEKEHAQQEAKDLAAANAEAEGLSVESDASLPTGGEDEDGDKLPEGFEDPFAGPLNLKEQDADDLEASDDAFMGSDADAELDDAEAEDESR